MNTQRTNHETDDAPGAREQEALVKALAGLPGTPPPRAVWERIEAQAEAEGLFRASTGRNNVSRWLAGSGIAAAVAIAVLNMSPSGAPTDGPEVVDSLPTVPAYDPQSAGQPQERIRALMVQSQLLERDLRRLPNQPAVARAATLATIDELQLQIASIDQQLIDPGLSPEDQALYWRERVRLMDSLLQLRYAQAQRVSF